MAKLFCYGTLNLHEVQSWLWGEQKQGVVKKLTDYRLNAYPSGIFYLTKEFGETVAGKVYEVDNEQLKQTDSYEGSAYKRIQVNIEGDLTNVYVRSDDESKLND